MFYIDYGNVSVGLPPVPSVHHTDLSAPPSKECSRDKKGLSSLNDSLSFLGPAEANKRILCTLTNTLIPNVVAIDLAERRTTDVETPVVYPL